MTRGPREFCDGYQFECALASAARIQLGSVMSLTPCCLAALLIVTPARLAVRTSLRCILLEYRTAPCLRVEPARKVVIA